MNFAIFSFLLIIVIFALMVLLFKQNKILNQRNAAFHANEKLLHENMQLHQQHEQQLKQLAAEWTEKNKNALNQSRRVLRGQLAESFCPFQANFPYAAQDLVFLGNSVDFVVFKNLNHFRDTGKNIEDVEIVFLEIKTGSATLNKVQHAIQHAIEHQRVRFDIYNPDQSVKTSVSKHENFDALDFRQNDQNYNNYSDQAHILKARREHPRSSYKWSEYEKATLLELYEDGYSLTELSKLFQRSENGIQIRLKEFGYVIEAD